MSLRLALVTLSDDGEITLVPQPGYEFIYASMTALETDMRKRPDAWAPGTKWTLVDDSRAILTVSETTTRKVEMVCVDDIEAWG